MRMLAIVGVAAVLVAWGALARAGEPPTLEQRVADLEARVAALEGKGAPTSDRPTRQQRAAMIAVARVLSDALNGSKRGSDLWKVVGAEHAISMQELGGDAERGAYGFEWKRREGVRVSGMEADLLNVAVRIDIAVLKNELKQDAVMKAFVHDVVEITSALERGDVRGAHVAVQAFKQAHK